MNGEQLKFLFESSALSSTSKMMFLEKLLDGWSVSCDMLPRLHSFLERREIFPVNKSRFVFADLHRRLECISWDEDAAAISGAFEIVRECLTVAAGDCNNCMGDELIFMWDSEHSRLVKHCGLCGHTLDVSGNVVSENSSFVEPTEEQLSDCEVCD
jgi:hypothetical protein